MAELVSGTTIQKKLKFLEKSQYWSREQIEEYQDKKLREIIKYSYENVPYYTKLFDKLGLKPYDITTKNDLKKLPVLTKKIIRDNYKDLLIAGYEKRSYGSKTSGSTGDPIEFRLTKEDFSWIWAAHLRAWHWAGYSLGDKHLRVSQGPRKNLSRNIQNMLMRCVFYSPGNMDTDKIKEFIVYIQELKPLMVYTYASTAQTVGEYVLKNKIFVHIPIIITTADNLVLEKRKNIEMAFNTKVYDDYGCGGEGLKVASQCEEYNYHVSDELMIAEYVKGEITITSFSNHAMPLIRYQPGDLVTSLKGECKCGKTLSMIKSVNGRATDYVITKSGAKMFMQFFGCNLLNYVDGVQYFKIIQKKIDEIDMLLVVGDDYNKKSAEAHIRKTVSERSKAALKVNFIYVDKIPPEKSGKVKIIDNRLI